MTGKTTPSVALREERKDSLSTNGQSAHGATYRFRVQRFWTRQRLAMIVAVSLLLVFGHPLMLRGLYGVLLSEAEKPVEHYDRVVVIFGEPACLREAAALVRDRKADGILIIEGERRSVKLGAAPSLATIAAGQMTNHGVPTDSIEAISVEGTTIRQLIHGLQDWMEQHGNQKVGIVCPRYQTRYLHTIIQSVLPETSTDDVQLCWVKSDVFDEDAWWRSSTGIKRIGASLVRLVHAWCVREPNVSYSRWTPEGYESWLRQLAKPQPDRAARFDGYGGLAYWRSPARWSAC